MFEEEIKDVAEQKASSTSNDAAAAAGYGFSMAKEHMQRSLDPDPKWRVRWQRRKVMQMIKNGGRMTKEERIKMTEKEVTHKSENLNTSTKKLMHLSRQIAGKTVDDAITQMRYTKKKMGAELLFQLKFARDKAIVGRGMGLGSVTGELMKKPQKIQTKDGKWMEIDDPTKLYIDQAWVGKGPPRGRRIQYHSRGRMSTMMKPSAREYIFLCPLVMRNTMTDFELQTSP